MSSRPFYSYTEVLSPRFSLNVYKSNHTRLIYSFKIPVNSIHPSMNPSHPNLTHQEVPPGTGTSIPRGNRETRMNNTYLPHSSSSSHATSLENGLPPDPSPPTGTSQYQHRGSLVAPQPSPAIR